MPDTGTPISSHLLTSPTLTDERSSSIARLVYQVAAVQVVCTLLLAPVLIVVWPGATPMIVPALVAILVKLTAAVALARLRKPLAAVRVLVVGSWAIAIWFASLTGGLMSPALPAFLLPIVYAGMLLGWRDCVASTIAAAATVFAFALAHQGGMIAPPEPWVTPMFRAGIVTVIGVLLAILQIAAIRRILGAFSKLRHMNEGLSLAEKVYQTTSEGIVVTLPDGTIVDVNDSYCRIHSCSREFVIGENPRVVKSDRHPPEFYEEMWHALATNGEWCGEIWNRRSDGTLVPVWLAISSLRGNDGELTHYVGVFSDISTVKHSEESLEWLATHDPLTTLPNRALIDDRLNTLLARAHRGATRVAVFFFDLDQFKNVNDTRGHFQGDRLLLEVARRCKSAIRESDTVGRSGGDEFVVIVSDFTKAEDLENLAERLLEQIALPMPLDGVDAHISASVGIAVYPDDSESGEDLMFHADLAMYRAKSLGGNRFEFFSASLREELERRIQIEAGLRKALAEERLFLHYQPQVDLLTGRIAGVEALVRWRTEDGTVIPPGQFIGIAEHSGLCIPLGQWVLRTAAASLKTLNNAGHDVTMAVNLSSRQLSEVDLPQVVADTLDEAGVRHESFELEITETALMTKPDVAAAKIETLLGAGVGVAIDDFGTGYASMNYVQQFRPSKLKIDRCFVSAIAEDLSAKAIVGATIALAKGIGATIVAEGLDSDDQVAFLQEHGCDYVQGFLFSKPLSLEDLLDLLEIGPFEIPHAAGQTRVGIT